MEKIIEYLRQAYEASAIIVYGSYADGTNGADSDFDALVLSCGHRQCHDTSFVGGVRLDVFIYPTTFFERDFDCDDFVQIVGGRVVADVNGQGKRLLETVTAHLQNRPPKTQAEIDGELAWCLKMLARAKRGDVEGAFRWHWLLTESLEIYCDTTHQPYMGPKKSLNRMERSEPAAFACYQSALTDFRLDTLESWVAYLKDRNDSERRGKCAFPVSDDG